MTKSTNTTNISKEFRGVDYSDHAVDSMRYAFAVMAPKLTRKQRLVIWFRKLWKETKFWFHSVIYKIAFAIGLGWELNRLRHWLGLYPKYGLSGRCQWCGEVH